MNTREKVRERNRIEGITKREPTDEEIVEHDRFVNLEKLTVVDLARFVKVYQPNAELRLRPGLDVRVGNHVPPRGGLHIGEQLDGLINAVNNEFLSPWAAHVEYETLHPFTDGNGRSGRAVWYWMMGPHSLADLGFLHAFYYQTLSQARS